MKNSKFEEKNKLKKIQEASSIKKNKPSKKLQKKKKYHILINSWQPGIKWKYWKHPEKKKYVIQRAINKIIITGLFPESKEARWY